MPSRVRIAYLHPHGNVYYGKTAMLNLQIYGLAKIGTVAAELTRRHVETHKLPMWKAAQYIATKHKNEFVGELRIWRERRSLRHGLYVDFLRMHGVGKPRKKVKAVPQQQRPAQFNFNPRPARYRIMVPGQDGPAVGGRNRGPWRPPNQRREPAERPIPRMGVWQ